MTFFQFLIYFIISMFVYQFGVFILIILINYFSSKKESEQIKFEFEKLLTQFEQAQEGKKPWN